MRFTTILLLCLPLLAWADSLGKPEEVFFTASVDSTEQAYIVRLPPNFDPGEPHDVLIRLHGHGSDRWQQTTGHWPETRAARDVACRHDMVFVSPDYRARTSWMGPKAEADLVQIIAELRFRYWVRRVYLSGGSMGGTGCLTFTALHPDLIAGVASMNGTANLVEYTNFQDAIRESFGGDKASIPLEYKRRSAEYWPERFTMPVGVTAGGKDTTVPADSVVGLATALKQMNRPVLLIFQPDAGHSTTYEDACSILEYAVGGDPSNNRPEPALTEHPEVARLSDTSEAVFLTEARDRLLHCQQHLDYATALDAGAAPPGHDAFPLAIRSHIYERGLGVLTNSFVDVWLGKEFQWFEAELGVPAAGVSGGSRVIFEVYADNRPEYVSKPIGPGDKPRAIRIATQGANTLRLVAYTMTNEVCPATWANARLVPPVERHVR